MATLERKTWADDSLGASRSCPALILDTDMGNDIDDALALAMLHALEDAGECRLAGVTVCKDNVWAALYTRLVNIRAGRPEVPVGLVRRGVTPEEGYFVRKACMEAGYEEVSEPFEEASLLLRHLLAAAEDQSLCLISIGFFTNLRRLLESGADAISPLAGEELIRKKVRMIVSMAGGFDPDPPRVNGHYPGNPEYNVRTDAPSARAFIARCPVPMVFSGWEIGHRLMFPGSVIEGMLEAAPTDVLARGYALFQPMPYDRPSWDMTAVLYAVREADGYFELSPPGTVSVDAQGRTAFEADARGLHRYLILKEEERSRIQETIVDLCTRMPARLVSQRQG